MLTNSTAGASRLMTSSHVDCVTLMLPVAADRPVYCGACCSLKCWGRCWSCCVEVPDCTVVRVAVVQAARYRCRWSRYAGSCASGARLTGCCDCRRPSASTVVDKFDSHLFLSLDCKHGLCDGAGFLSFAAHGFFGGATGQDEPQLHSPTPGFRDFQHCAGGP